MTSKTPPKSTLSRGNTSRNVKIFRLRRANNSIESIHHRVSIHYLGIITGSAKLIGQPWHLYHRVELFLLFQDPARFSACPSKKSLKLPNQIGRFREIVSGSMVHETAYPLLSWLSAFLTMPMRSGYAVVDPLTISRKRPIWFGIFSDFLRGQEGNRELILKR